MDVSCRSPGSNSWDPFRPNSSQPLRNTVRLSCYAHKSHSSWEYIILLLSNLLANCAMFLWYSQRTLPTSPAIGVGSLLIFFTSPGFIALRSLDSERKKNKNRFHQCQHGLPDNTPQKHGGGSDVRNILAQQDAILQTAAKALVSETSPRHSLRCREMRGSTGHGNGRGSQLFFLMATRNTL